MGNRVNRGAPLLVHVEFRAGAPREPLPLTSRQGTEAYRNYWAGPDDTMARVDRQHRAYVPASAPERTVKRSRTTK